MFSNWSDYILPGLFFTFIGGLLFLVLVFMPIAYFHDKKECEEHGSWYTIKGLCDQKVKSHTTYIAQPNGGMVPYGSTSTEYVYELTSGDLFVADDAFKIGSQVKLYHTNSQGLFYQRGFTQVKINGEII